MVSSYIPLGYHCNISFLMEELGLKGPTSLFEYFESKRLQSLTDIVRKIQIRIDDTIVKGVDHNLHMLHEDVFSYHYRLYEFKNDIFKRRAMRFLHTIQTSNEILFIRILPFNTEFNTECPTEKEINDFCDAVRLINPKILITFLLVQTISKESVQKELDTSLLNPKIHLLHRFFYIEDCHPTTLIENNRERTYVGDFLRKNITIQTLFKEYLKEAGFVPTTSQ